MRTLLLVVALIATVERAAEANCVCLPKLSPGSGTVPVRGSLYLGNVYLLARGDIAVSWVGAQGTATWTKYDDVARLDYSGPDGSELVVTMSKRHELARYKLDSGWRAPATAPSAIRLSHEEDRSTCASTDAIFVALDQSTAAVRARWTYEGTRHTWFLPTDRGIALGRNGCCGSNISPEELHDGGMLELTAIRVDGSQAKIVGVPSFIAAEMFGPSTIARNLEYADSAEGDADEPLVPPWLPVLLSLGLLAPLVYMSRRIS